MNGYSVSKDPHGGVFVLPNPESPTDLTTAFRLAKAMASWPLGDATNSYLSANATNAFWKQ